MPKVKLKTIDHVSNAGDLSEIHQQLSHNISENHSDKRSHTMDRQGDGGYFDQRSQSELKPRKTYFKIAND